MLPLAGVKVIEFCQVAAGPFCGMLLADMGADVIGVDRELGVDPMYAKDMSRRGKKSIVLDLKNGGSVQGEIRALNEILKKTVYRHQGEGGTYVVPGHGYLADEHEVLEYRDMVVIVRDRVKAMIDAGATLAQVKAARVTADYDTQYGANTGPWTTEMFVEAVYTSLKNAR